MATKNTTKDYEVKISLPGHAADKKVPRGYCGLLTIKLAYKPTGSFRSVYLKKRSTPLLTLSIVGEIRYGLRGGETGGQCVDEIRMIWGHIPEIAELCNLWDRWHLNDMNSGTKAQMEVIRKLGRCPASEDWLTWTSAHLALRDLLVDQGYTFGHAWLFEVIPAKVVVRIKALAKEIDSSP